MSDLKPSVIRAGKFEMVVDFTFSDLFDKVIRRFERPQNKALINLDKDKYVGSEHLPNTKGRSC
ncbi:unnamed protein product [Brassica oleracea var. botrytis]